MRLQHTVFATEAFLAEPAVADDGLGESLAAVLGTTGLVGFLFGRDGRTA